ncbi:MAG: hypothetical protein LPK19_03645, partial [Hymenobacteraceae bacterium]|nr:hypothetical protein [Hymenobacteraceae bacterium]MDX5395291.1 hypothetical protein [Hymenobacteraceae bacterium]MDX5511327.1 hypothetical protein [Hymenobacteraceae bacterium]
KKLFLLFAAAGLFTFASCDSPREEEDEELDEEVEEMTDESNIEAVEEACDEYEDYVDMVH